MTTDAAATTAPAIMSSTVNPIADILHVPIRKAEYLRGGNVIPKPGHPDEVNCLHLKTKSGRSCWCALGHVLRRLGMKDETMLNVASLEDLPHGSIPDRLFKIFRTKPGRLALLRTNDINDSTVIDNDADRIAQINEQLAPYQIQLQLT